MRAMVTPQFGGPELFEEQDVERPEPGPGEVLVRVVASGTNPVDALNHEPLILALVDAKVRAEEELERVRDRAERPEGVQVAPREDERLMDLMRRCDALTNACSAMEDWSGDTPEYLARYLPVLTEMRAEASRNFEVYRREVGLPEPGE